MCWLQMVFTHTMHTMHRSLCPPTVTPKAVWYSTYTGNPKVNFTHAVPWRALHRSPLLPWGGGKGENGVGVAIAVDDGHSIASRLHFWIWVVKPNEVHPNGLIAEKSARLVKRPRDLLPPHPALWCCGGEGGAPLRTRLERNTGGYIWR